MTHSTARSTPIGYGAEAGPYRAMGWRIGIFSEQVWALTGQRMEALDLPWPLAAGALGMLRVSGYDAPVISVPGPARRIVVLTRPHLGAFSEFRRDTLPALDAVHLWAGVAVDLPPTPTRWGPLSWLTPSVTPLPNFASAAAAVLAAATARG